MSMSILRQLRAILLPVVVAVVVPGLLVSSRWPPDWLWGLPGSLSLLLLVLAAGFFGLGLLLVVGTIAMFASMGQGTLAPWDPPHRLVVRGVYCYVRNPMISGVFFLLVGETLLLSSRPVLYWLVFFVALNLTYIPLLEEPALERRFGADYAEYKRCVPRWIPRVKPWERPKE